MKMLDLENLEKSISLLSLNSKRNRNAIDKYEALSSNGEASDYEQVNEASNVKYDHSDLNNSTVNDKPDKSCDDKIEDFGDTLASLKVLEKDSNCIKLEEIVFIYENNDNDKCIESLRKSELVDSENYLQFEKENSKFGLKEKSQSTSDSTSLNPLNGKIIDVEQSKEMPEKECENLTKISVKEGENKEELSDSKGEVKEKELSEKEDKNVTLEKPVLERALCTPDDSDDSSDEAEVNYLTRGPVSNLKNSQYRFTPLQPQILTGSNYQPIQNFQNQYSNFQNYSEFNVSLGSQCLKNLSLNDAPQSYFDQGSNNCLQLNQVQPPELSTPFQGSFYPQHDSKMGYSSSQIENDLNTTPSPSFQRSLSQDQSSGGFESYVPLSPPQSVSPFQKDGRDGNGSWESFATVPEDNRDSDDLIKIINSITETPKPEPRQMPEAELMKLRSALEGDEEAIRSEMSVYLNDEAHSQYSTNLQSPQYPMSSPNQDFSPPQLENSFSFDPLLTPPKSVSPIQQYGFSPIYGNDHKDDDLDPALNNPDSHLSDILNGIQEIAPDELNIYLNEEEARPNPALVRTAMQNRCQPSLLDNALRRLVSLSTKNLCKADPDGDTCLMIVYSKPEDSASFYENVFCLQEKLVAVRLCCDTYLGKTRKCRICGNSNASKFHSPLSMWNHQGDTALSCAVKSGHSALVVDYLLCGLLKCEQDCVRVFNERGRLVLQEYVGSYPSLATTYGC